VAAGAPIAAAAPIAATAVASTPTIAGLPNFLVLLFLRWPFIPLRMLLVRMKAPFVGFR
jgi:hypothetical protein